MAADDSRRGVGARQRARGPLRLPLFIILPGSCGGNGCKGKLVLPLAVHHQRAGSARGHTNWITGGVDGGSDCQCVCVCVWWSEDENDGDAHFACNVSSALLCAGDVQFKGAFALCLAQ